MDTMRVSSELATSNFSLADITKGAFSFKQADAALIIDNKVGWKCCLQLCSANLTPIQVDLSSSRDLALGGSCRTQVPFPCGSLHDHSLRRGLRYQAHGHVH